MKFSLILFAVLCPIYFKPSYTFDLKNIIFGNGESGPADQVPPGGMQQFGYRLPPRLMKQEQPSGLECAQGYYCQDTKSCVADPKLCPCRSEADIKCPLGKDWYTCIRGDQNCDQLGG